MTCAVMEAYRIVDSRRMIVEDPISEIVIELLPQAQA
jgi:Na+-translocating ferredoxin:NAD+ oxidoreductase RNF subunit RnfB